VVVGDRTEDTVIAARGDSTVVIVLVGKLEVDAYRNALAAGADGVVHIDADPDTISLVVRAAITREVVLPAEIARRLAGKPKPSDLAMSAEEMGMLQRLSDGATVVQLADEFYLAERSVRRRLENLYVRLGVSGRAAALKRASQLGLVE
jgi:DNA-binding NarL/FixJ family response regulator